MVRLLRSSVAALAIIGLLMPAGTLLAAKGKRGGGGSAPRPAAPTPPSPAQLAIIADQKDISAAQAVLAKASKDYNDAAGKLSADFEKTPEVEAAKKSVKDANDDAQAARAKALDALPASSPYKVAAAKEAKAKDELDKLRNADTPDKDAIADKSTEVFQDGNVTSKLEHAALEADPAYSAADKKLADANGVLAALRSKFKESLKTEESLATLRTAKEDAQTKLAAAQAKLESDRKGGVASAGG